MSTESKNLLKALFWQQPVNTLTSKRLPEKWTNLPENLNHTMTISTLQSRTMLTICPESATKRETDKILTTTTLSLQALKTINPSWPLSICMAAILKMTMLPLDSLNISVWLWLPTNGIPTKLMKSARKFWKDVFQFFTSELAKPSTECNSLLLEKKELLFMLQKRLTPSGTSRSSEKERMKNFGNEKPLCVIHSIFL